MTAVNKLFEHKSTNSIIRHVKHALSEGLPFLWVHYEVTDICDKRGKYKVVRVFKLF